MKSVGSDWYKKGWTLDIKKQPWVEDTAAQVDFIIRTLALKGSERILDLACGFGRHALDLARRGFSVVGVDITEDFIADAAEQARRRHLNAEFILSDIRQVSFQNEFDVVLSIADGAIGYLEDERENLKIFNVIANALKAGGRHFMDIINAEYADRHFPCQTWDAGQKGLTLSRFEWDKESRILLYGQSDTAYGETLQKPDFADGNPTRLYRLDEIEAIMQARGMHVASAYSNFLGEQISEDRMQMIVISYRR